MANKLPPSICLAGNLNLDLMISGIKQIPSWGEEQFGTQRRCVTAGQAGYMGIAAARLGTKVSILGLVGADSDGASIQDDLRREKIDCSGIRAVEGQATGLTVAIIREDGERCFVSEIGASSLFDVDCILSQWDLVARHRALAIVGIFNTPSMTIDGIQTCFDKARKQGIATVFDSGWDTGGWQKQTRRDILSLLSSVDIFLPNEDEACAITQVADVHLALDILAKACSGTVVIKMGSKGSIARVADETIIVPARPVESANAVGAGDVYDAAFVSALQFGSEFKSAMEFASDAAAYYVARIDDRFPSPSDITSNTQLLQKMQEMSL
ncbi:carbohydrate kinase family protein [Brucella tritici]|uniref:Carbohydrate kinase family protein n=1 Tax=Brucella tritici TaxID=94626 RepID=A0A7V7VR34_9HYPH|nr:carbohydrate kinase family protein [Brucella tritici]KAB2655136.1 carbohydrate kinase family protein [Brucella tritici]